MKNKIFSLGLVAGTAALAIASAPAQAASVVFDGGAPILNGLNVTSSALADDFQFSQDTTVTTVNFWTVERDPWDGTLQYNILADESGKPGSSLFTGNLSRPDVTKTATGRQVVTGPFINFEALYSFNFAAPVTFSANTRYWLGLHLNTSYNFANIYWSSTASGFGLSSYSSPGLNFDGWTSTGGSQRAFQLLGPTAVPEPSPLAGLLGFGVIGGALVATRLRSIKLSTGS